MCFFMLVSLPWNLIRGGVFFVKLGSTDYLCVCVEFVLQLKYNFVLFVNGEFFLFFVLIIVFRTLFM